MANNNAQAYKEFVMTNPKNSLEEALGPTLLPYSNIHAPRSFRTPTHAGDVNQTRPLLAR